MANVWTNGPSGLRVHLAPPGSDVPFVHALQRDGENVTPRRLARDYPARSPEWNWLRKQGIVRPHLGGPESRRTVAVKIRLSPEDAERLFSLAAEADVFVSELITSWISEKSRGAEKSTEG